MKWPGSDVKEATQIDQMSGSCASSYERAELTRLRPMCVADSSPRSIARTRPLQCRATSSPAYPPGQVETFGAEPVQNRAPRALLYHERHRG